MLAAPLKVAAGVEVEEVVAEEDVVDAFEAVAETVVELPAGKGTGATGVEVVGVEVAGVDTGVDEVEVVEVVDDVEEVLEEVLEVDEAAPLAIALEPPEQGKVTM